MSFQTRVASKTCMIVGRPMWRYPIALPKPPPATAPLIEAIRQIDCRPFRVISHAAEDGKVFNASFFHDEKTMHDFGEWYAENALAPGSEHHQCLRAKRQCEKNGAVVRVDGGGAHAARCDELQ